jgi:hypothetical protein
VVAIVVPLKAWKKMADDGTPQQQLKTGDIKWSSKGEMWLLWDGEVWRGYEDATATVDGVKR